MKVYNFPLKVPFAKGKVSFYTNKLTCPYPPNSDEAREWERGFNAAYLQNLRNLKQRQTKE